VPDPDPPHALMLLQSSGAIYVPGEYRGWTHRLLIAGTTGNQYTVSMRVSDRVWGCSCHGWNSGIARSRRATRRRPRRCSRPWLDEKAVPRSPQRGARGSRSA